MNDTKTNEALAKAVEYLGAVEVAPGRYAIKTPRGTYLIATAEQVAASDSLDRAIDRAGWHEDLPEMPLWWSPEQRFAWRIVAVTLGIREQRFATRKAALALRESFGRRIERITADLNTGEEVPA